MESPSMLAPTMNVVGSSSTVPFFHRYYILLKAHYFLFFSAFGILYPILNITLRSRGLSNTEISYINLIVPFLVFFTNPLMGFIADHSRRYLLTFNIVLATVTIIYSCMFLLPSIKTHHIRADMIYDPTHGHMLDFCASQEMATKCSSRSACGCTYYSLCRSGDYPFNFTFTMNAADTRRDVQSAIGTSELSTCGIGYRVPIAKFVENFTSNLPTYIEDTSSLATCNVSCTIAYFCHGVRYPQQTLYVLLYSLLFIIGSNFLSNSITIGASIGFASLPQAELFGRQRVWGTVGFGLSAFAASGVYALFKKDYVYIIMFGIVTLTCMVITTFIPVPSQKKKRSTPNDDTEINEQNLTELSTQNSVNQKKKKNISQSGVAALIPLLKEIDVIVFLSLAFIWGMSYAGLDPYVYLYIDEIAPCASHSIVGLMSLICAISEVIALFLAVRLLRILGTNACSILILIAFSIRFAGYYYILQPYYILPMETMHFFNFGIFYVLIAQKADSLAPPGLSGTLQGVVYGVSFGLGRGVGLIISSFIYTRFQSKILFLCFSLFNASAAIIYSLYFLVKRNQLKQEVRSKKNANVPQIVIEPDTNTNAEPLLPAGSQDNKIVET